jgi:hypothetical protein
MATATRKANTEETDTELADAAGQMQDGAEPENKGILAKIRTRFGGKSEAHAVTLPDGRVVSAEMGKFLRDHPDAIFLGSDINIFALEKDSRSVHKVPWVERLHRGTCERVTAIREFARLEVGVHGKNPGPEIWVCVNQNPAACIGRTLSRDVLIRIGAEEETAAPETPQ